MKTHNKISLAALLIFFLLSGFLLIKKHQTATSTRAAVALPPARPDENGYMAVNLENYEAFKKAVMPLIDEMAAKKIVSLGEGTHGTYEFNKLRFWITRILVEEKGFSHIAFENDYSDSYLLNEALKKQQQDLKPLMQKYLIRIWQNKEVEEMLRWMQAHTIKNKKRLSIGGIDNMYVSNDAKALKALLTPLNHQELNVLTTQLLKHSLYQDSIWNNQNDTTFTFNTDQLNKNGVDGWLTADKLEKLLNQLALSPALKELSIGFLQDSKQGFNSFYQWNVHKRGSSRDSCMAEMATFIARKKGEKLVVWAHNAHVAKKGIWGGAVGGTGGFIEKKLPGQYYVLGTGTAGGTFAAMEDGIINYSNRLASYPLEAPLADSWEHRLAAQDLSAFYASAARINPANDTLKHRHIGYNPTSGGEGSYDKTNLRDLYDAFFFIRETTAAHFIE